MTRRHLQSIAVKNSSAEDGCVEFAAAQSQRGPQSGRVRSGRAGGGFVVNSFEHRHRAQQQLLEQQQQQLAEQRRLIDEMQALQRQQLLQQRLAGAQQQKSSDSNGCFEPKHLHSAIASIQRDVLQDASAPSTDRTDEQLLTTR